jgi:protein-L-isoaspartate(D-aspartate) O-methyltransferase
MREGRPFPADPEEAEMTIDLAVRRSVFAEEIEAVANLRTPGLVDALARVPREAFLGPGPWTVRSESDIGAPLRQTPDGDARHVYHNLSVAIDPGRMLFNGQPGLVCLLVDALGLGPGRRVLHVGCGTGYYSALMGEVVGAAGRVAAVEVDEDLAATAGRNLAAWRPSVTVVHGNGTEIPGGAWDAILVNAGVTHPLDAWLDGLAETGRLVLPLTATAPAMGPIGKGIVALVSRDGAGFAARVVTFVAIYSAVGVRDEAANAAVGEALKRMPFPRLTRLRRDPHPQEASCWLHTTHCCFS